MATLLPGQTNARNVAQSDEGGRNVLPAPSPSSADNSEFLNAQRNRNSSTSNNTDTTSTSSSSTTTTDLHRRSQRTSSPGHYFVSQIVNGANSSSSGGVEHRRYGNDAGNHGNNITVVYARRNAVANIFDGLNNDELARLRTTTMVGSYNGLRI